MSLIHFILDLVGFLLWLNWRSLSLKPSSPSPGLNLLSTIRRTEPARGRRWEYLIGIILLLMVRPIFYWQIGAGLNWTPRLDFGLVVLPFRSDYFSRMALYSAVSFGCFIGVIYLLLLLFATLNRNMTHSDPIQRLLNSYLGVPATWPAWLLGIAPWFLGSLCWANLSALFVQMNLHPASPNTHSFFLQSGVMGLSVYGLWIRMAIGLLLLYVLNSYVYFGNHPFWQFIQHTGGNLTRLLKGVPLRFARIDFAPLALIGLLAMADWYGKSALQAAMDQLSR